MTVGRRIVCITGMHRSGTSVVSRVVNLLGIDLGDEADLLDARPNNPRGFWESLTLTRFGESLLQQMGGSWDDPPVLADGWEQSDRLDQAREAAVSMLARSFAGSEVAGWKDPRSSILLPFWRTATTIDRTVVVVRDPRGVAGSLASRNRLHPERSAYLWLRYMVGAWRNDRKPVMVHYDDVVDDPSGAVRHLTRALALPSPDDATMKRIADAVEPQLRHPYEVEVGPMMRLALEHHGLLCSGDSAAVDLATEEINQRWLQRKSVDDRIRRCRRLFRPLVPRPVRRRVRQHVGQLSSWPLRQASMVPPRLGTGGVQPTLRSPL